MRSLVVLGAVAISAGIVSADPGAEEARYPSGELRRELIAWLDAMDQRYNPEMHMITSRVGRSDYTKLDGQTAHSVRASSHYARLLLEANAEPYRSRGIKVLRKVLSLQNGNKWSLTYGVWPYHAEEPLDKMFMPDFNWAGFIGRELLFILIHQADQLPDDVLGDMKSAIRRACESMKRRPLHMGYTNIASMNTYTLVVAGERLGDEKLLAYGRYLFNEWYDYTMRQGSFTEFNSTTYTRVAQGMTAQMLAHFQDPALRAKAQQLNDMLWIHQARRFHEPTHQWAGPHSRAYHDLSSGGLIASIQRAIDRAGTSTPGEHVTAGVSDWRVPDRVPTWLAKYISPLTTPRHEVEIFLRQGEMVPNGLGNRSSRITQIPIVGTTYLHPSFALGTVNTCDFWEQHRNLMAHWGTPDKPTYMTMRCVNGGHGFCSAMFASVQDQGRALVGVGFVTDNGDRYLDLDKLRNGRLKSPRLAVEFEIGGAVKAIEAPATFPLDRAFVLTDRGRRIEVRWLGGGFADVEPKGFLRKNRRRIVFGVELHPGPEKTFNMLEIDEAFAMLAVSIRDEADPGSAAPRAATVRGRRRATWGPLVLEMPTRPMPIEEFHGSLKAAVDGKPPWSRSQSLLSLYEANR